MRIDRVFFFLAAGLLWLGCGYSQQEWDQRARALTAARAQADTLRVSGKSCGAELEEARAERGSVQEELARAGLAPETLRANLPRLTQALQEFKTREGQIADHAAREARWTRVVSPLSTAGVSVTTRGNRLQIRVPHGLLMREQVAGDPRAREVLARIATATLPEVEQGRRVRVEVHPRSRTPAAWALAARQARAIVGALRAIAGVELPMDRFVVSLSESGAATSLQAQGGDTSEGHVRFVLVPTERETLPLRRSPRASSRLE